MFSLARMPARLGGSHIAYAIALATGVAVGVGGLAAPAYAQKQSKPKNSKGFIAAYSPVLELSKDEAADEAALREGIAKIKAAIENDDDRYAAGAFTNSIGVRLDDMAMQRSGILLMIESGKVPEAEVGKFYYTAGQIAYNDEDYAAARESMMKAAELGYSDPNLIPIIADTYFQSDDYEGGLNFYRKAINERVAAGGQVPADWLQRALSTAYNNDLAVPAIEFAAMQARYYPTQQNWRDAINIQRNLVLLEGPELLDLMRLAYRAGTMETNRDYLDYVDAADSLRSPGEVKRILDAGIAAGVVNKNDAAIADALSQSSSRIAGDRADLVDLEAEAMSPSANASLTTGTADAFLSYEDYAKAEALYKLALEKPGVNASLVNMRLGIAQFEQGKIAEAKESFSKVTGQRRPIAALWQVYIDQQAKASPAPESAVNAVAETEAF